MKLVRKVALAALLSGCAAPATEGPMPWQGLIEVEWSLDPGEEKFLCALQTVHEDTLVSAFRARAPTGTHHTLLTVTQSHGPDEVFECDPGTLSDAMVFASGIATDDLVFPEGVATRIPAGKQVLLNLHLLNSSAQPLSGRSGTEVRVLAGEEMVHEAEMIFAGTTEIQLAPMSDGTANGTCAFRDDATVLSLWPHMHQYGRHMRIVHRAAGEETALHDAPFRFDEQLNYPIAATHVARGEFVDVTCHWQNTSSDMVVYGDSSSTEMCFAGLYRYPAAHEGLFCHGSPVAE